MAMFPAAFGTMKDVLRRCTSGPRRSSSLMSLILILMVLMAACGPTAAPAAPAAAATEAPAEATEAPAEAEAPAATEGETIKVGILHSLSGTMAISEVSVKDATLLAIEEINAAGGINGKMLEPIIEDGASDWPTFAEKARS